MKKGNPVQRCARERLNEIYSRMQSWGGVERETGINKGQCWKIAHGRQRASKRNLSKLGVRIAKSSRIPWKKKYLLLRKFIGRRKLS